MDPNKKPKPTVFVLKPCKLREDRFVQTDDDPLKLSWKDLLAKFAPRRSQKAVLCLRGIRIGGYVGVAKGPQPTVFFFINADRSGKINPQLIKNKQWVEKVGEVYYVETADWGAQVTE